MNDNYIEWPFAKSPEQMLDGKDAEIERLQARIDALMLEFCPDEMTPEQVKRWGEHQKPVTLAGKEGA